MNLQTFFVTVQSSLALGCVYALVGLSFTMIYAATGYFHLGVAAFVTLGAVGAYTGTVTLGLPWIVTAILVMVVVGALGVLSEFVAVRPIRGRAKNDHLAVMVSTLGFMIVVDGLILLWFGADARAVPSYLAGSPWEIGDVPIRRMYLVMVLVLVLVTVILEMVMRRTTAGRVMRAAQDDPAGLELLGVSFQRVVLGTFALAGVMGGLAGLLLSPISFASPFVGHELLVYGFAAMGIGGFGSFAGSVVGGLVIGTVVSFESVFWSPHLADPLVLLVALVILMVRPSGLFGGHRQLREV